MFKIVSVNCSLHFILEEKGYITSGLKGTSIQHKNGVIVSLLDEIPCCTLLIQYNEKKVGKRIREKNSCLV